MKEQQVILKCPKKNRSDLNLLLLLLFHPIMQIIIIFNLILYHRINNERKLKRNWIDFSRSFAMAIRKREREREKERVWREISQLR